MKNFPIDDHFEQLCKSVFRVELSWTTRDYVHMTATATAFVITITKDYVVLATAGHVLNLPKHTEITWKIQRFDHKNAVDLELQEFASVEIDEPGKPHHPYRCHKKLDLGVIVLNHTHKLKNGETVLALPKELQLKTIARNYVATIGTTVGWAGFPATVESMLGRPTLCYAQGVVSSVHIRDGGGEHYIVDGHSTPGFSGGPVWYWCETTKELQIIGIISSYLPGGDFPGFCFFEGIHLVKKLIKGWNIDPQTQ